MINYSHLANSKIFLKNSLQEEWKILTQSFELKYEKPSTRFFIIESSLLHNYPH